MTTVSLVEKNIYMYVFFGFQSGVSLNKAGSTIISICLVHYLHLVHSSVLGTMFGTYGQLYNVITAKGNSCTVENEFPLGDSSYLSFRNKKKHSSS